MGRRSKRIRRTVAAVLFVTSAAAPTAGAGEPEPVHIGSLGTDQSLFFDEGYIGDGTLHSLPGGLVSVEADRCALENDLEGACFIYTFDVTGSGEMLRVGFDTPMRDDNVEIFVTDPAGRTARRTNPNHYSVEMLFPAPALGTWTVKVVPYSADDSPFRLRAKVESVHHRAAPDADGYLLPNLRVLRMWEFGFVAPANPLNGLFPPDDLNPPLEVGGVAPLSCAADEMLAPELGDGERGARRCLRYSFGLGNAGGGNFDIRWTGDRVATATHDMIQCVQRVVDGVMTVEPRPAGTGSFHRTHGHWHYDDVIFHRLYSVDRSADVPAIVPVGKGKKIGYSPADQAITDWEAFTNAPAGTSGGAGNCAPGTNQRLGMSSGWGDAYRYQRPGNYVEFSAAPGDGEYVVQTVADPSDNVLESNEGDNVFYAHLRVTGDDVEVLEQGVGESPWDPDKVVVEDWWL